MHRFARGEWVGFATNRKRKTRLVGDIRSARSKQRDVHSLSYLSRLVPRARTFVLFKQFYNRVIGRRDSNFPIVLVPGVSNFNVGALVVCMNLGNSLRLEENRIYDRIVAAIRAVSVRRNFFHSFRLFPKTEQTRADLWHFFRSLSVLSTRSKSFDI